MSQAATPLKSYRVRIAPTADGGGRVPDLSPQEAVDRWLDHIRASKRERTVSSYHYRLKLFVEFCEVEEITCIRDLTGWDLGSYEVLRNADLVKPITINKQMGTLREFLKYCARNDLVDESLPQKVSLPDVPRDAHVDETMLHPDDAKALLNYYENDPEARHTRAHALLALAWYTGARLGALRGADLGDYDSDAGYLFFVHRPHQDTPLKNGSDGNRPVGLPRHVCDIIDGYIENHRHKQFDDCGRKPLITSQVGRASTNAIRAWMYLATMPCLHSPCPHGNERETCEYVDYSTASKCPSSRSPHQVRTGSITWHRHRGWPVDELSDRVNASARVIEEHYDKPDPFEALENRRREHVDRLGFDPEEEVDEE
jgi:integrase